MILEDPYPTNLFFAQIINPAFSELSVFYLVSTILLMLFLISCSALFSASENALFSLSQKDLETIENNDTSSNKAIIKLLSQPKKLLATILIANNFVNVTFIIISSIFIENVFNLIPNTIQDFLVKVVVVTLILLLFGEVVPKVYATKKGMPIAKMMALPLVFLSKLFGFLVYPMVTFTSFIDKRVKVHEHNVSADELSHAIDITSDTNTRQEEKEILKGIVNFGNKTVRQIMKSRIDVAALDNSMTFAEMISKINDLGYSRFPVYEDSFDQITGIIYIKEVLPYINENENFNWNKLLKPAFFVPDNKRIDLLLSEFQEQRMHMAIVVDEYGGKLGIVTMEDILEEIFGEINDEFDEDQITYSIIDDKKYIVEGKMLINDFCKISHTDSDFFEEIKGESETIAGMLLEINGKLPFRNEIINFKNFRFTIESVDNRRIKRIKVEII